MKQEIIEYVKQKEGIENDKYDVLLGNYFDLGELQVQKYIGCKKLTTTLYLVVKEFVLHKFENDYLNVIDVKNNADPVKCYKSKPVLDEFFEQYRPLLLNYRSLCGGEMWLRV